MLDSHAIKIADRIKELSYTMGTGNLVLVGSVPGFNSFGSVFSNNNNIFYAVTDGVRYEVGSGIYLSGIQNELKRFPIKSSNSDNLVNFPEGIKEVYSTYPATNAVYSSSGIKDYKAPKASGIAYWANNSILNYDGHFLWDDQNKRLGIRNENPQYSLDIGGDGTTSLISVSGVLIGTSGIYFPPVNNGDSSYTGGRQTAHYEPNRLDDYALQNELIDNLTGSSAVIELSGVANNFILFKKQNAGLVLAGPPSGCIPPCSPGYPSFRPLTLEDIPNLSTIYSTNSISSSISGILDNKINSRYTLSINYSNSVSGILNNKINNVSGVLNNKIDSVSGILNTNIVSVSGTVNTNLNTLVALSGILTNYINSISGVLQQAIFNCCSTTTTTTASP